MVVTAEATTRQKVTVSCARKRCDLIMIWMVCSVRNDDEGESMLYYFAHEPKKQQNKREKTNKLKLVRNVTQNLEQFVISGQRRKWHGSGTKSESYYLL